MATRRLRIYRVGEEAVAWSLTEIGNFLAGKREFFNLVGLNGVPDGAVLVNVRHSWEHRAFCLLYEHESFPEVPDGELIPSEAVPTLVKCYLGEDGGPFREVTPDATSSAYQQDRMVVVEVDYAYRKGGRCIAMVGGKSEVLKLGMVEFHVGHSLTDGMQVGGAVRFVAPRSVLDRMAFDRD